MSGHSLGTDPDTGIRILCNAAKEFRRNEWHGTASQMEHVAKIIQDMMSGRDVMNAPVDNLIADRARTHGDFQQATVFVQAVKTFMRKAPNWHDMPPAMQESLDMVASKVSRILHGDPEAKEHWEDLEGYSRLVVKMLEGE